MKCQFFLIPIFGIVLSFSSIYGEPIAIRTTDIADLSNYLSDPLFSPYFGPLSTIIDFEGPWSPPDVTNAYFNLGSVGSTYNSLGIEFGSVDTFMGGHSGFGYITPNTVVGDAASDRRDGPISIDVVIPGTATSATVTSIGAFVADGPTNNTTAWFYDINNNLLGSVTANPSYNMMFLGWSDSTGISKVVFTNGAGDDYYIDNLTFEPIPVPAPGAFLLGMLGLCVAGLKLRKHA